MPLNKEELIATFLELVKIDSESFNEGEIQSYLVKKLKELVCEVCVDNAAVHSNSTATGNVIAKLPGTIPSTPFLLAAHMDTVVPGKSIKPQVSTTQITSDGTTILGADDKAGIAIILEIIRTLTHANIPHPPLEILFTLTEENGMVGSKNLDISLLQSREGLILDNEELTELLVQGPATNTIEAWITGVAAHAGVCPEKGISALEVAAYAINQMKLGRIDEETVANFGIVKGGMATNIVMEEIYLKGEARSLSDAKLDVQTLHIKDTFEKAITHFTKQINGKTCAPSLKFVVTKRYSAVNIAKDHPIVKSFIKNAQKYGVSVKALASGGGSDANVLAGKGFTLPNVGVGCRDCHTVKESLQLEEFFTAFNVVLETVLNYKK